MGGNSEDDGEIPRSIRIGRLDAGLRSKATDGNLTGITARQVLFGWSAAGNFLGEREST